MSDYSLKIKLINNIYKYISEKQGDMPLFHGNDVSEFYEASEHIDLPIGNPYRENVNHISLQALIRHLSTDKRVNMSGFGMMRNGKIIAEYYTPPYGRGYRHVSYSMCKSVTAMAIGIACDKNYLSLDEKLCDIFPEHDGIFFKKWMKDVTIKHLLTMTAGVKYDEVSSYFHYDWCKAFMGSDIDFEPGSNFAYNSLNTYMLSAVIKAKTGKNLMDFLNEQLFLPLGIMDVTWDKCPKGIERGGWGMKLSIIDMLKLGQLYLNDGCWIINGRNTQLISKKWIKESTQKHVELTDKRVIDGYGYQIWLLKDGAILFNGVFGQNVYINKKRNIVIAITASAYELFPDGHLVEQLCRFSADDRNFEKGVPFIKRNNDLNIKPYRSIDRTSLKIKTVLQEKLYSGVTNRQAEYIKRCIGMYFSTNYVFDEYASSILPLTSQVMYSNYSIGIEAISIEYKNRNLFFNVKENGDSYSIILGCDNIHPYAYQVVTIGGKQMPVAASAGIMYDEEEKPYLRIRLVYLEEIGNRIFKLYFSPDELKLQAIETPNMLEFSKQLIGEEKMQRTKKIPKLQAPDYMLYKIKTILSPTAIGKKEE